MTKSRLRMVGARAGAATLLACAALLAAPALAAAPSLPSTNVAWLPAAADADIERAFAQARAENKPLLLYWGATWCPPCNQLKATLFNRQDFAALSRSFVAVHVDGDRPGAQKISRRFKVSAYPTVLLLRADGSEITRLPGEVDAPQVLAVLQHGLAGGRNVKAVLADALAGKALQPAEWRQLAFYSWDLDEGQLMPKAEVPGTLARLAAASPASDAETQNRLWLKALAASEGGEGVKPDAALRARVLRVLADPATSRQMMDVLTGSARTLVNVLEAEGSAQRAPLIAALDRSLQRLQADATLSRADRQGALLARVELARLGQGLARDAVQVALPAPLVKEVREQIARDDREIRDGYERQAVITSAAWMLGRAGLWADSEALLKANLAKSHSPYYLMSQLGGNARRQGRTDEALRWYGEAFDKSEGPATRLQWGAAYLTALVDLAPQDAARIEAVASQLFAEAAKDSGAFDGRSARSLQRVGGKLLSWNKDGARAAALKRLQDRLAQTCAGVETADGRRAACEALLKPADKAAA